MGILLLIITGLIYGLVGTVILHFINNIFALFGEPTILEQPFILDFLQNTIYRHTALPYLALGWHFSF